MPNTQPTSTKITLTNPQETPDWETQPPYEQQRTPQATIVSGRAVVWGFDPPPVISPTMTVVPRQFGTTQAATNCANGPDAGLDEIKARLDRLRAEGAEEAIFNTAKAVLKELGRAALFPARVALSADREIAFVFFDKELVAGGAHRRVATLTCGTDEASVLLEDRTGGKPEAWDVDLRQLGAALERIRSFVAGK